MESKELTIVEQKPAEVITRGHDAATQLQQIVSSREKKLMLGGKQYLFFEDWQTIGKFYGVTAKIISTEELKDGDKLIGFLANAVAVAGNNEVSGADAECTFDEQNWKGKPRYQLRSMAQTRACAKALRNCLGWVAVLAGYEATPAEEMSGVVLPDNKEAKATIAQLRKIYATVKEKGYSDELAMSIMIREFGTGHSKELTKKQASEFIEILTEGKYLEEAKSETTNKPKTTDQQQGEEQTSGPVSREALELQLGKAEPPKTAGAFLTWLKDHDIKAPRTWLEVEWDIPSKEMLTIETIQELYTKIKYAKKW